MKHSYQFIVSAIAILGLAYILPEAGATGGWLHSERTTRAGIFIIFFLQGLILPSAALRRGLLEWRLHLFCQSMTFIGIPLLFLASTWILRSWLPADIIIGMLYLAILPTTLSTSVVFTTQAGGNTVGAIFNASVGNILGIFIVPVLATLLLYPVGSTAPLLPLLFQVMALLLLPLVIGYVLRPYCKSWIHAKQKYFKPINSLIIYFILYVSFCNTFEDPQLQTLPLQSLCFTIAFIACMLSVITGLAFYTTRFLRFNYPNATCAVFCASQKTLAAGVPMAQFIFAENQQVEVGLILLPILIYHPLQLALGGYLIDKLKRVSTQA